MPKFPADAPLRKVLRALESLGFRTLRPESRPISEGDKTDCLEHLLTQVTTDNLHKEIDTGPAAGSEAW